MRILLALTFILMLASLPGCASFKPGKISDSYLGKSMVVVSTYDEKLDTAHSCIAASRGESHMLSTSSWNINDDIESQAVFAINESGRFKASPADSNDVRALLTGVGIDNYHTKVWAFAERKMKIQQFAKTMGAELVLLFAPYEMDPRALRTNKVMNGYGVFISSQPFASDQMGTLADMEMILYDGATGEEITWATDYRLRPRDRSLCPWSESNIQKTRNTIKYMLRDLEDELLVKTHVVSPPSSF